MKILVYDPLYSEVGHYKRYNRFILEILSKIEFIEEIVVLSSTSSISAYSTLSPKITIRMIDSGIQNIQLQAIQLSDIKKKIIFYFRTYRLYHNLISEINKSNVDLVFFTSQGLIPFWLAAKKIKKKYIVSAISIKWLLEKHSLLFLHYYLFKAFLTGAQLTFATEECYKRVLINNSISKVLVSPDRYLAEQQLVRTASSQPKKSIQLITVGTISKKKNPILFLKEFIKYRNPQVSLRYSIIGKILDDTFPEIHRLIEPHKNITIRDSYISAEEYEQCFYNTDYVVIPYDSEYTKYATSGVMWDCFERMVPVICPDTEPFKYYIEKYRIGYVYSLDTLEADFNSILKNINASIDDGFRALRKEYSKEHLVRRYRTELEKLQ
jgi:glycosyltransferase involved in cell wall biosynthesis